MELTWDWKWAGVALCVGALLGALWWLRRERSYVAVSRLPQVERSWRVRLTPLVGVMRGVGLFFLLLALTHPRLAVEERHPVGGPPVALDGYEEEQVFPMEGAALYLVLDQSGSMERGMESRISRIEALRRVTADFIRERRDDLIGLVAFARVAHVLCPLTLDRKALLEEVAKLAPVRSSREDGTAIGYALFKTANLIAATRYFATKEGLSYEIKGAAVVLITDGIPNPHPLDRGHPLRQMEVTEAARYAAEQGIRVYIVNVEPLVMLPQYEEQRRALETAATETGGRFFVAGDLAALQQVYGEIDQLERSHIPQRGEAEVREQLMGGRRHELMLAPYLIAVALGALFCGLTLQTTLLRRAA